MSGITQDRTRTFKSTNDLSASQFCFVKLDTTNQNNIVLVTAATDTVLGVLQNAPKAGDVAQVLTLTGNGTTLVAAGAAIALGARVMSNGSGQAITATQTTAGSQPVNSVSGITLEAATALGDLIEVALKDYMW